VSARLSFSCRPAKRVSGLQLCPRPVFWSWISHCGREKNPSQMIVWLLGALATFGRFLSLSNKRTQGRETSVISGLLLLQNVLSLYFLLLLNEYYAHARSREKKNLSSPWKIGTTTFFIWPWSSLDIVCIIKESTILCPIQHLAHLLPVVDEVREGPGMDLHMLTGQPPHRNPEEFLHPGQRLHKRHHQKKSIPPVTAIIG